MTLQKNLLPFCCDFFFVQKMYKICIIIKFFILNSLLKNQKHVYTKTIFIYGKNNFNFKY